MLEFSKRTNNKNKDNARPEGWHKLSRFYLIVSCFCIGTSVLAIASTMLIAHHNLEKNDVQIKSITHLIQGVDWWGDYQAHKTREKIFNMQIDNLNISLHETPNIDPYKQQLFAKYLFLDKDLHDDSANKDSISNLRAKAEGNFSTSIKLENQIGGISNFIITYEFITILLIVAASLAGISEIAKNKLLGYSAFCVGGAACVLLIITLSADIPHPIQSSEQEMDRSAKAELKPSPPRQSIFKNSTIYDTSSAEDLNQMYRYCTDNQTLITPSCGLLFSK